jgi:hypothetical protein
VSTLCVAGVLSIILANHDRQPHHLILQADEIFSAKVSAGVTLKIDRPESRVGQSVRVTVSNRTGQDIVWGGCLDIERARSPAPCTVRRAPRDNSAHQPIGSPMGLAQSSARPVRGDPPVSQ